MKKICMFALCSAFLTPAFAESVEQKTNDEIAFPHGMQIGVGASLTGGLDGFIGYENKNFDSFWWKRFGVRLGFATTSPLKSNINSLVNNILDHSNGFKVGGGIALSDTSIKAKQMSAIVDFYPFGDTWFLGGWRVSGGYYNGSLSVDADLAGTKDEIVVPEYSFKLNDTLYKYSGGDKLATGKLKWKYSGPYVGTGFDIGLFSGLKIYLDAGLVFADDSAKLDLSIPSDNLQQSSDGITWTNVSTSELETAKSDALSTAQHKLDKYDYYPIVKLGFMYRF
ncbi:MAG: hypothetical protein ACLRFI_01660 [Alphaproteobacteria bacterium]